MLKKIIFLLTIIGSLWGCDCSGAVIGGFSKADKKVIASYKELILSLQKLNKTLIKKIQATNNEIIALNNIYLETKQRTLNLYKLSFYAKQETLMPFNYTFVKAKNLILKEKYYEQNRK